MNIARVAHSAISLFWLFFFVHIFSASDLHKLEDQIARHPTDYKSLYNLGVASFKAGDFEKSQSCFSLLKQFCGEKIKTEDECVRIFYNAGNTEFKLKNYQDALTSFERVLNFQPTHEKARQKRDYIKRLLEQQQKEQSQQNEQADKNSDDDKNNKNNRDQNKKDGSSNGEKDDNKKPENKAEHNESEKQSKNNEDNHGRGNRSSENADRKNETTQQSGECAEKSSEQQQLLALAERLDNQAQEQIIRQHTGMRTRTGGQHEW